MAKDSTYKIFTLEEVLEHTALNNVLKNLGWVDYGVFYDSITGQMILDGSGDVGHLDAPVGDIYIEQNAVIKLVDVSVFPHVVVGEVDLGGGISWVKITKTYIDFSAAATSKSISLYTLPIKGVLHNTNIKPTSNFVGGGITSYTLGVGIVGNLNRFAYDFDVFQSVGDQIFGQYVYGAVENFGSTTDIQITSKSTGANLNAATQGSVDVQIFFSTLS